MPLLKPVTREIPSTAPDLSDELKVLQKAGLEVEGPVEKRALSKLDKYGLDLDNTLSQLAILMSSSESDGVKLSAVKMALQLHQHPSFIPKQNDAKETPQIQFMINGNLNLQQILNPGGLRRTDETE